MLCERSVESVMMSRNFWVCGACLPHVKRALANCEESAKLTVHPFYWGFCSFCFMFPLPTHQSIRLPIELIEASNERTSAPQMREVKPLKTIEARLFEYLAYALGKNPLKRISERLFARQRAGSMFIQMLTTRFTTLLEEYGTIVEEE